MLSGQLPPTSTANNFVGQYFVDENCYNVDFDNQNSKQEKEIQSLSKCQTHNNNKKHQQTVLKESGNSKKFINYKNFHKNDMCVNASNSNAIDISAVTNYIIQQSTYTTIPPLATTTTTESTGDSNIDYSNGTALLPDALVTTVPLTANTNLNNINNNNVNNNNSTIQSINSDAAGRSAALERAYVHDVYANCVESTGPIRPRVAQFLASLEPGSIVCDVGCGNGRYLTSCNPLICTIGVDRCYRLTKVAKDKGGEVALCDNLELPFRDESFDAVLSLAVVHHFATTERRVGAIRELARILRIGGRVIISVWALEQRHRRFESQDVLIPWQPPKNRSFNNYSDEEDDDEYLPPYHAYTEDSTNSSRSAGDGDSSSLSSSSPGESCYSFVRRAIQKLAGRRKHPWFLESWNSKDTKNDSSLDYEDAKDLPIELRRLEDFEDFPDPPLSAGLKSRSLGSILNPPPRQIVRSRSSVPILGGYGQQNQQPIFISDHKSNQIQSNGSLTALQPHLIGLLASNNNNSELVSQIDGTITRDNSTTGNHLNMSPTKNITHPANCGNIRTTTSIVTGTSQSTSSTLASHGRRPKLIKQKQSLCDEEYQLSDNSFGNGNHNLVNNGSSLNNNISTTNTVTTTTVTSNNNNVHTVKIFQKQNSDSKLLRKQSSLNEELMAENRLREKERVRKRIQKQMSLNEAFLCRSVFTKRLQVIREGFTTKLKTSTGSLERVTKNSLIKIMKNFQPSQNSNNNHSSSTNACDVNTTSTSGISNHSKSMNNDANNLQQQTHHQINQQNTLNAKCSISRKNSCHSLVNSKLAMQRCIQAGTHVSSGGVCTNCNSGSGGSGSGGSSNSSNNSNDDQSKPRRHSRESGSDSSKDSSLQSDTSIESEDSFASVIFIPKTDNTLQQQQQLEHHCNYYQQQQQQLFHQQQKNSSSTNSSGSTNGISPCICVNYNQNDYFNMTKQQYHQKYCCKSTNHGHHKLPSVPTSPLIMPCPPTPAHSPAAQNFGIASNAMSPPLQNVSSMLLSPPNVNISTNLSAISATNHLQSNKTAASSKNSSDQIVNKIQGKNCKDHFTFDETDIIQQQQQQQEQKHSHFRHQWSESSIKKIENSVGCELLDKKYSSKITRQSIKDLPQIPKFRKKQLSVANSSASSLSSSSSSTSGNYSIVRRCSASATSNITKLMAVELFNPETDDLDSDSSEASSPDSIDSVINNPTISSKTTLNSNNQNNIDKNIDHKDTIDIATISSKKNSIKLQQSKKYYSLDLPNLPKSTTDSNYNIDMKNDLTISLNNCNDMNQDDILKRYKNNKDNLIITNYDILKNNKLKKISSNGDDDNKKQHTKKNSIKNNSTTSSSRQELIDFAEQLSAQLLKRIDEKTRKYDIQCDDNDDNDHISNDKIMNQFSDDPYSNNDNHHRDLNDWREELRERRLNLANLSTQHSLQPTPISSSSSSLSSQTRSYTIHEEDENDDGEASAAVEAMKIGTNDYSFKNYYDIHCKNLKYKLRGNFPSSSSVTPIDYYNHNPETAFLIQDGDNDSHEDDDEEDIGTEHHRVIMEEDEENDDDDDDDDQFDANNDYCKRTARNTIRCQDDTVEQQPSNMNNNSSVVQETSHLNNSNSVRRNVNTDSAGGSNTGNNGNNESWALSNSSNSLDSPSQSGGSTTHHRYYHVFREGELDALINHHVTSLHIVSSYYERASWCIVAEKVQVWTI